MPIQRLRTRDLSESERADLEEALRDPARFHSDGRAVTIACVIVPMLLAPLWLLVLNEALSDYRVYGNPLQVFEFFWPNFPYSLGFLWNPLFLALAGSLVTPIAIVAVAAYGWRTYGRHGHVIASFGVIRIRGDALRLLRYADMVETDTSERNYPLHRIVTDELELKARGGGSLVLYGFGLEPRRQLIEKLRRRVLDDDDRKGPAAPA